MDTASQGSIRMRDREERKNHSSNHFCGQPRWYYLISFILVCLLTPNADHDPASSAGKRVFYCTPFGGKGILYADSPGDRASDFLSLASQATDPPTISPGLFGTCVTTMYTAGSGETRVRWGTYGRTSTNAMRGFPWVSHGPLRVRNVRP